MNSLRPHHQEIPEHVVLWWEHCLEEIEVQETFVDRSIFRPNSKVVLRPGTRVTGSVLCHTLVAPEGVVIEGSLVTGNLRATRSESPTAQGLQVTHSEVLPTVQGHMYVGKLDSPRLYTNDAGQLTKINKLRSAQSPRTIRRSWKRDAPPFNYDPLYVWGRTLGIELVDAFFTQIGTQLRAATSSSQRAAILRQHETYWTYQPLVQFEESPLSVHPRALTERPVSPTSPYAERTLAEAQHSFQTLEEAWLEYISDPEACFLKRPLLRAEANPKTLRYNTARYEAKELLDTHPASDGMSRTLADQIAAAVDHAWERWDEANTEALSVGVDPFSTSERTALRRCDKLIGVIGDPSVPEAARTAYVDELRKQLDKLVTVTVRPADLLAIKQLGPVARQLRLE